MAFVTKKVDAKCRITLPPEFVDAVVIMERGPEGECIIRQAEVVPKPTAWFWKNKEAQAMVSRGLKDLEEGRVSEFDPADEDVSWLKKSGDE